MANQKVVYLLVPVEDKGSGKKTYFNRAGVAFENRDGSLNVKLDLFPQVTFQIRDPQPNGEEPKGNKPF